MAHHGWGEVAKGLYPIRTLLVFVDINRELVAMVLIAFLGVIFILSPYTMITVNSGSMEPEIETISDVVVVDTSDSNPDVGEIIVYDAATIDHQVTHRVVEESPKGYVTKGDNNVMTDQESGEPPVTERRVNAVVVQIGESPLIIPAIGHLSILFTTYRELILTLLIVSLVLDGMSKSGRNPTVKQSLKFLSITCLGLVLIWSSFVLLSLDSSEHRIVEVQDNADPEDPSEIEAGEEIVRSIELPKSTHVYPTQDVVEIVDDSRSITGNTELIDRNETNRGTVEYTYRNPPIEKKGVYVVKSVKHVYPVTLPRGWIIHLHNIHPLAASLTTVSVVGVIPIFVFIIGVFFARQWQKHRSEHPKSEEETDEDDEDKSE